MPICQGVVTYLLEDKLLFTIKRQTKEIKSTGHLTCDCKKVVNVVESYKCYYCGEWFCPTCADDHFGVSKHICENGGFI
jgi:hypothetical protein